MTPRTANGEAGRVVIGRSPAGRTWRWRRRRRPGCCSCRRRAGCPRATSDSTTSATSAFRIAAPDDGRGRAHLAREAGRPRPRHRPRSPPLSMTMSASSCRRGRSVERAEADVAWRRLVRATTRAPSRRTSRASSDVTALLPELEATIRTSPAAIGWSRSRASARPGRRSSDVLREALACSISPSNRIGRTWTSPPAR